MSALTPMKRLAFRPLSSRCQCRFASEMPQQSKVYERSGRGLSAALLDSVKRPSQPQSPAASRSAIDALIENRESNTIRAQSSYQRLIRRNAGIVEEERQAPSRGYTTKELEQMMSRTWQVGEIYSPHDLTGVEMSKQRKLTPVPYPNSKTKDVFDHLGINPLKEYKNIYFLSDFVSETGRIRHRKETGLRPVNQRRMAKAVKRAIGIGLMPRTHKHPEILKRQAPYSRR